MNDNKDIVLLKPEFFVKAITYETPEEEILKEIREAYSENAFIIHKNYRDIGKSLQNPRMNHRKKLQKSKDN